MRCRKLKVLVIILYLGTSAILLAQDSQETVYRIADHIVSNTTCHFINIETGERFSSAKDLPVSEFIKIESPYNEWKYWNGVLADGMIELGKESGNDKYTKHALDNYNFTFDNLDYFLTHFQEGMKKPPFYLFHRMSRLDDCGAMAMGLCEVYALNKQKRYLDYLQTVAHFISHEEVRMDDGAIVRPKPRTYTMWADDLYMSVPFLVRMAQITGESRYLDDAILLVEKFFSYLYNEHNGLYYHCWYSDNQQNGVAHWGRCNGWVLMAQVELLDHLPENHPKKELLISLFEKHLIGLSRFQDYSGLWHQVIDRPDSYLESSATAMFVYGAAKAINMGWISSTYAGIAVEGWRGLEKKITPQGEVEDICIGTGIEDNIRFYYDRPTQLNDIHGLGAVLLAGVEMIRLERLIALEKEMKLKAKLEKEKNKKINP